MATFFKKLGLNFEKKFRKKGKKFRKIFPKNRKFGGQNSKFLKIWGVPKNRSDFGHLCLQGRKLTSARGFLGIYIRGVAQKRAFFCIGFLPQNTFWHQKVIQASKKSALVALQALFKYHLAPKHGLNGALIFEDMRLRTESEEAKNEQSQRFRHFSHYGLLQGSSKICGVFECFLGFRTADYLFVAEKFPIVRAKFCTVFTAG